MIVNARLHGCTDEQWQTVPASPFHDRQCKTHTICQADEWETVAADPFHDRQCKKHTVCTGTEYQTREGGAHHDRECAAHTKCTEIQWESKPAGTHHDRLCTDLTVCSATQWEIVKETYTSDRRCKDHTVCASDEWESHPGESHHDRECTPMTTCTANQWESKPLEWSSDRICTDCNYNCPSGQVHEGCGGTSPGACRDCVAGRFKTDAGKHSCSDCAPGKFADKEGLSSCADCPRHTFQPLGRQATCQRCDFTCPDGQYHLAPVCSLASPGSCGVCPRGQFKSRESERAVCEAFCSARQACRFSSRVVSVAANQAKIDRRLMTGLDAQHALLANSSQLRVNLYARTALLVSINRSTAKHLATTAP